MNLTTARDVKNSTCVAAHGIQGLLQAWGLVISLQRRFPS